MMRGVGMCNPGNAGNGNSRGRCATEVTQVTVTSDRAYDEGRGRLLPSFISLLSTPARSPAHARPPFTSSREIEERKGRVSVVCLSPGNRYLGYRRNRPCAAASARKPVQVYGPRTMNGRNLQ